MTIRVNYNEIPGTVVEAKRWWRSAVKKVAAELKDGYRSDASEEIRRALCSMDEYKNAETIMLYVSAGKEVITSSLMNVALKHGKTVCLPLCMDMDANGKKIGGEHVMEARLWNSEHKLVPGAYGIPTPDPDAPTVRPEDIDLVVLPCVTCDVECNRLGHGAGYYDRYLTQLRDDCATVAICYEEVLAERIPVEPHDRTIDAVVTEEKIYRSK